tara:strand:- start:2186 stop:3019 length:834 start_codon:yes stop_codon:yes gene_type:complete
MTRSQERATFVQLRILENVKRSHKKISTIQDLIMRSNVRFVAGVALSYNQRSLHHGIQLGLDDLMSEGMVGLMEAMMRFDPLRNFKFITYAVWWIRNEIINAIIQTYPITPSQSFLDKIRKMEKEKKKLEQSLGRYLSAAESFDTSEIRDDLLEAYLAYIMPVVSLEKALFIGDPETGTTERWLRDTIPDNSISLHDDEIIKDELFTDVRNVIDSIENLRERFIIKNYHGIETPSMVLEDIGKSLGLTRERVRQLYWLALRRMSINPVLRSHRKDSY